MRLLFDRREERLRPVARQRRQRHGVRTEKVVGDEPAHAFAAVDLLLAALQLFLLERCVAPLSLAFLAQPLSERQHQARLMRDASTAHQAGMGPDHWSDVDDAAAARWLTEAGSTVMVHGHTHRPATHGLPGGGVRHVLGDWDLDHGTPRAQALRLTASGLHPLDIAARDARSAA